MSAILWSCYLKGRLWMPACDWRISSLQSISDKEQWGLLYLLTIDPTARNNLKVMLSIMLNHSVLSPLRLSICIIFTDSLEKPGSSPRMNCDNQISEDEFPASTSITHNEKVLCGRSTNCGDGCFWLEYCAGSGHHSAALKCCVCQCLKCVIFPVFSLSEPFQAKRQACQRQSS